MNLNNLRPITGGGQYIYIETYGCQMNVNDSEIVLSIMTSEGWRHTEEIEQADLILINTCSVRDNAEQRIWGRLNEFKRHKREKPSLLIGVIGCMAGRLKEQLIEKEQIVDIVAGPDAYRDMPKLVQRAGDGAKGINVQLSMEETYAEISPIRLDRNGVSAFIAIMRGCNNMCSYCVVPFTRGRERSRDPQTILKQARELFEAGYREVTLLGQNVNSYNWHGVEAEDGATTEDGAENGENGEKVDFPTLLREVAQIDPKLRVRFATSHPKDLSDNLITAMVELPNICRSIHLPAQSGSSEVLQRMNRRYTREWYLERMNAIKQSLPDCTITTDLIAGFCGETEQEHQATLSLMREVGYDFAYMFKYSERPDTKAARTMDDNVSEQTKTRRLSEIIALQNELSLESNQRDVGKRFEVLIEGVSKRSEEQLFGRSSQNKVIVFDRKEHKVGQYVEVEIMDCTSATLLGRVV